MAQGRYMFLCGTPKEGCVGTVARVNHLLQNTVHKFHPNREAAFDCHKKYLVKQGYKVLDSRTLAPPNDGPVRVMTKKSKFGAILRPGKEGTRNQPRGHKGGILVSC